MKIFSPYSYHLLNIFMLIQLFSNVACSNAGNPFVSAFRLGKGFPGTETSSRSNNLGEIKERRKQLSFDELKSIKMSNHFEGALQKATNEELDLGGGYLFHNPLDFLLENEKSWRMLADEFATLGDYYEYFGIFSDADFDPSATEYAKIALEKISLGDYSDFENQEEAAIEDAPISMALLGAGPSCMGNSGCPPSAVAATEAANYVNGVTNPNAVGPWIMNSPEQVFHGQINPGREPNSNTNIDTAPNSPARPIRADAPTPRANHNPGGEGEDPWG